MSDSDEEDIDDDELDEEKEIEGEVDDFNALQYQTNLPKEEIIIATPFTYKEATSCLHMLGKDESGCRYAYLMITAIHRNLTDISVVLQFVHILFLDFTGNNLNLDAIQILEKMPYLLYLKVEKNIIETCDLRPFSLLQVLNFSRNRIVYTNTIHQPELEALDLNYNFIEVLELNGENLPKLKILEARGNLLPTICGICLPSLDSLYLAENKIETMDTETLSHLVNLRVLHLRNNYIRKLEYFSDKLAKLQYLNLRKNKIAKLYEIGKLWILPELDTLIISQNTVGGDGEDEILGENADDDDEENNPEDEEELGEGEEPLDKFRVSILIILPNLKRINKKMVSAAEKISASMQRGERYIEIMGEKGTPEVSTLFASDSEIRPISSDAPEPE